MPGRNTGCCLAPRKTKPRRQQGGRPSSVPWAINSGAGVRAPPGALCLRNPLERLRLPPLRRHPPRPDQQQPARGHVPARAQAAGHHGALHAATEGRPTCSGPEPLPMRQNSGHTEPSGPSPSPPTPERQNPEPCEMIRGLPAVLGRGLEPRWLLTASTSSARAPSNPKDSVGLERQEATESGPERQIPVTCERNSGGEPEGPKPITDLVVLRLAEAGRRWEAERDSRSLRRALLDLLQALDE
jgi:hypothetical protein